MKQLSRNFLSIILGDLGRRAFGFLTIAYLAHRLSPSDFGAINIGFAVLSYALMAASGGLSAFGTRAVAREDIRDPAGSIAGARLVNSLAALILVGCLSTAIPNALTSRLILIFCLSLIPGALNLDWYLQGKEAMGSIGAARTLSAALYFLLVVGFVHSSSDILLVAVAAVFGDTAATLYLAASSRRRFPYERLWPEFSDWKSLTVKAFPLGLGSLLAHASVNLPPLVLGIVMTNSEVGMYSAAGKLVTFLLVVDRVIATLLLPASARSFGRSPEALSKILNVSMKWMIIVALPVCVGGSFLARRLITLVFGEPYAAAGVIFSVLIWFFLATLMHTVYTTGLIASGQEKLYGRIMMTSALIYLCTTVGLTALFGPVGCAAAVVFSESVTVVIMAQGFRRYARLEFPPSALKSVAAAAGMGAVLFMISAHLAVSIVSAALVYLVVLFALRGLTRSDFDELMRRV